MSPYIMAKFRKKLLKKDIYHVSMMLECNLKFVGRVLLFANSNKSSRKSTHGTRLCGVAQGLYTVLSVIYAGNIFTSVC